MTVPLRFLYVATTSMITIARSEEARLASFLHPFLRPLRVKDNVLEKTSSGHIIRADGCRH